MSFFETNAGYDFCENILMELKKLNDNLERLSRKNELIEVIVDGGKLAAYDVKTQGISEDFPGICVQYIPYDRSKHAPTVIVEKPTEKNVLRAAICKDAEADEYEYINL